MAEVDWGERDGNESQSRLGVPNQTGLILVSGPSRNRRSVTGCDTDLRRP